MARRTTGAKAAPQTGAARPVRSSQERFKQISRASSQIVKDAAALLDEELAAGIVAARNVEHRFQAERRIDQGDFKDALQRFQGDAHEVVNLLNDQLAELRSEENTELINRLVRNAHELLDVAVGLVNLSADVANQLAEANLTRPNATPDNRRRR